MPRLEVLRKYGYVCYKDSPEDRVYPRDRSECDGLMLVAIKHGLDYYSRSERVIEELHNGMVLEYEIRRYVVKEEAGGEK